MFFPSLISTLKRDHFITGLENYNSELIALNRFFVVELKADPIGLIT